MQDKYSINKAFLSVKRRLFDKVYEKRLNPEQCRAVFTTQGPLLVLAGAGSGKTTVLVNRIAYLIKYGDAYFTDVVPEGVNATTVEALNAALEFESEEIEELLPQFIYQPSPPWQVLAITFTNKAAKEIKDRLAKTFGDVNISNAIWAGTFHSICMRILRKHGHLIGLREGFSVYDSDDQKRLISQCMEELNIDEKRFSAKTCHSLISSAKNQLTEPDDYDVTSDPRSRDTRLVYQLYQKKLLEYNAVDFDDIIMMTVSLFAGFPEVKEEYQRKFKYVLVDEYQDTNYAQFVLTSYFAGGYNNIMVVGDDDQSIYRFRGATIENILNFDKNYPNATVIKLEQNYRSTSNILNAANAIISHNNGDGRHEKRLWSNKGDGEKIVIKEVSEGIDEGKYITDKIIGSMYREKRKYSDFAVLYRINALGRSLQTAFARAGIPFRVVGDLGFYSRAEIKDMLAYLSVVASPEDALRLKRIINVPRRKIGGATISAIESIATSEGLSMYAVMRRVDEYPVLSKSASSIKGFVEIIENAKVGSKMPSDILVGLFEGSGYKEMLEDEGFEGETKIENVNELISAAIEYEKRMTAAGEEPTLTGFLEEVSLISSVDKYDDSADAVVLMTVHAAKGLEFPVVFIAGMEDGIFPSEQNTYEPKELCEERRLAYVAITRAKERLYITSASQRQMYGRTLIGRPSVFVREELPEYLCEKDMPKTPPPRTESYGTRGRWEQQKRADYSSLSGSEIRRSPDYMRASSSTPAKRSGAKSYGVQKLTPGTRIKHSIFGTGTISSARDLGGDVLYEVRFDDGSVKKLMATYAKLEKI